MVFESQFQGQWYSADPGKIEALWSGSGTNWEKGPYSLVILPHAGWPYSLRGQSQVLKSLEMDLYEHVLLFSPSHYYKLETNGLFWGSFTNYEGPWGSIRGLPEQKSLGLSKTFLPGNTMIQGEHGVEMLLPGLSRVLAQDGRLGTFLVGPVANPDSLKYLASQVLEYIQRLKGGRVLLLVSSDMTPLRTTVCLRALRCSSSRIHKEKNPRSRSLFFG
jgi:AmmeMemoRadiSam system protein B